MQKQHLATGCNVSGLSVAHTQHTQITYSYLYSIQEI